MIQARVGLLIVAALMATPGLAQAQKPKAGEAAKPAGDKAAGDKAAGDKAGGDKAAGDKAGGDKAAGGSDSPGDKPPEGGTEPEGPSICEMDPSQCPNIDIPTMAKRPIPAQMYAVQQKYALRKGRVEINPHWNLTLNDQFVDHPGFGMPINYYFSDVMAIGLHWNIYSFDFISKNAPNLNRNQEFNSQVRRAARIGVPLTEYQWSTSLNFTYVPMYGKFAGFNYFIFHYDVFVTGGVGVLSNRPIAVIDPDNRSFKSKVNLAPNVGIGLRIFFNRWFAAILEVRDDIFLDKLESTTIPVLPKDQQKEENWYAKDSTLTNNVQAQIGLSVFLPFSFEYKLPK